MALRIDPEFRSLVPPLSADEHAGLEADIVRDGRATVPLIVWGDLLLDGHNRYDICTARALPYTTQPAPACVVDRQSAKLWIIDTSLNKRNLPVIDQLALRSEKAKLLAERAQANRKVAGQATGRGNVKVSAKLRQPFPEPVKVNRELAKDIGIGERTVDHGRKVLAQGTPELIDAVRHNEVAISTAAKLAELPPERQRAIVADGAKAAVAAAKELRAAKSEKRRQERVEKLAKLANDNRPLDTLAARYPIVYADPPWKYEHVETESRAIENQYPTMELDAICNLNVGAITTDDVVLFLWATSPKLVDALRVVTAWGFTYRTCMVWDKEKIGMGYYARQQHELLLICTKGNPPTPPPAARPASVVREVRGEHSAKPETFYTLIERMYPELPKIEMFCRKARAGWAVWGNQSSVA